MILPELSLHALLRRAAVTGMMEQGPRHWTDYIFFDFYIYLFYLCVRVRMCMCVHVS